MKVRNGASHRPAPLSCRSRSHRPLPTLATGGWSSSRSLSGSEHSEDAAPEVGAPGYAFVVHPGPDGEDRTVSSVAVCAGSGWMFCRTAMPDLFVTGEMSHHNALRVKMLGKCAVTVFHSNSERQFCAIACGDS